MKRRGFLSFLLGAPAGAAAAVAVGDQAAAPAAPVVGPLVPHPFRKEGALRLSVDANLSEVAIEDAVCFLVRDAEPYRLPLVFTLVVPTQSMFTAARICAELETVRASLPASLPDTAYLRMDYLVDWSMKDCDEWGIVTLTGRCFYSPGCF